MTKLIDVTHTVKASAAPSEGARYMFDPSTGERFWVEQDAAELGLPVPDPEPEQLPDPEVPPVPMPEQLPDPEVPPVPMPEPSKKAKKLHHG